MSTCDVSDEMLGLWGVKVFVQVSLTGPNQMRLEMGSYFPSPCVPWLIDSEVDGHVEEKGLCLYGPNHRPGSEAVGSRPLQGSPQHWGSPSARTSGVPRTQFNRCA